MNYIISGVAFTGNKGASGMAESIIQNLLSRDQGSHFYVYTYYPLQDAELDLGANVTILDATPKAVVINFLFCLWSAFCVFLKLPVCLYKRHKLTNAVLESDYWLDTSGISFADGREKFLIYNILSIFPALMLKCNVVKMSQALGPFKNPVNRLCAKLILPKIKLICARGQITCDHLNGLSLKNYSFYPDVAFALRTSPEDRLAISRYTGTGKRVIGISPSQVVYKLCENNGIDYLVILKDVIEALIEKDYRVVVFAHSIRKDTDKRHNNDLPLLAELFGILNEHNDLCVIQEDNTAAELRELIATFDVLIASRFHALISAICTCTPVITLGWCHKYDEVLSEFGISDYGINYDDFSASSLLSFVSEIEDNRAVIINRIKKQLPLVAEKNDELFSLISREFQIEKEDGDQV